MKSFVLGFFSVLMIVIINTHEFSNAGFFHVESKTVDEISERFQGSRAPKVSELANKYWECELVSAHTRMQKEEGLKLYYFTKPSQKIGQSENPADSSIVLNNKGAQVIKSFKKKKSGFIGRNKSLLDEIRMEGQGRLISRLQIVSTSETKQTVKRTLAYSTCRVSNETI